MGKTVVACNVIIMRVDGFAMMPNMTFGQAMSVYTGQNVGAGKLDRVTKGVKQGGFMASGFSAAITLVLLSCAPILFGFFTQTPFLIDLASRMIRIMAVGYICVSVTQVLGGVMRGAGDTVTPMWISIISTIFLRIPTAYLMAAITKSEAYPNGHPVSIFTSLLVSWSLGMVITLVVFRIGKWKKKMYASAESHGSEIEE
jgi:Na+-driven multidrug efflux pump